MLGEHGAGLHLALADCGRSPWGWRAIFATGAGVRASRQRLVGGNEVVLAIANQFKIPVKYIGVGEKIDDLIIFDKHEFVDSLFKGVTNS